MSDYIFPVSYITLPTGDRENVFSNSPRKFIEEVENLCWSAGRTTISRFGPAVTLTNCVIQARNLSRANCKLTEHYDRSLPAD